MKTFLRLSSRVLLASLTLAGPALAAAAPPPAQNRPQAVLLWPKGATGSEDKAGEEIILP